MDGLMPDYSKTPRKKDVLVPVNTAELDPSFLVNFN